MDCQPPRSVWGTPRAKRQATASADPTTSTGAHVERFAQNVQSGKYGRRSYYVPPTQRKPLRWGALLTPRERHLRRAYDLTSDEYADMLAAQAGVCAICGQVQTMAYRGRVTALHVDHDHKTGRVRALLCSYCNTGLGSFSDDPERLRAAADYLDRHRSL